MAVDWVLTTLIPALTVATAVPLLLCLAPLAAATVLVDRMTEGPAAARRLRRERDAVMMDELLTNASRLCERTTLLEARMHEPSWKGGLR